MKRIPLLHRVQVHDDAWIAEPKNIARVGRAADRLSKFGIACFVLYVAYLTFDAFFKAYRATY